MKEVTVDIFCFGCISNIPTRGGTVLEFFWVTFQLQDSEYYTFPDCHEDNVLVM